MMKTSLLHMPARHRLLAALLLAALLCAMALPMAAAEDVMHPVGYTARAILPDSQLDSDAGYFNLLALPEQPQVLHVEVTNHLDEPITILVEVGDATTNQNGLIAYSGGARQENGLSSYLTLREEDLAIGPEEGILARDGMRFTLAPHATVRFPFDLLVPDALVGQVLGGIVLSRIEEAPAADAGASMAIRSVYSYAIAVQLQSEEAPQVTPDFTLLSAEPSSVAGLDALATTLRNGAPVVAAGASLDLRVIAEGADTPLLDIEGVRVSMAPLSTMAFTRALPDGVALAPGRYTVYVDIALNGTQWSMQIPMDINPDGGI